MTGPPPVTAEATGYRNGEYSISQGSAPLPPPLSTTSAAMPTGYPLSSVTTSSEGRHGEAPGQSGDNHVTRQDAGDGKKQDTSDDSGENCMGMYLNCSNIQYT